MEHKHSNWPLVFILFAVAFAYFTFELVSPFAEQKERFKQHCEKAGGIVIDSRDYSDLCIDKKIFIEIK